MAQQPDELFEIWSKRRLEEHSSAITAGPMPFVVRSDSENENEAELVFLSPEEEVGPLHSAKGDQGASPVLRRSNRKRKLAIYNDSEMSKNSGSKKKKGSSPDPGRSMPKIPRTPQPQGTPEQQTSQTGPQQQQQQQQQQQSGTTPDLPPTLEALLLGMEGRLGSKIDSTNMKVDRALSLAEEATVALADLHRKVAATEENVAGKIGEAEARIMNEVNTKVKTIVLDQLKAAGFDLELTAADLSTRASAGASYAAAAATRSCVQESVGPRRGEELREDKYNEARRALRLWPIENGSWIGLREYLRSRLNMGLDFVDSLEGRLDIRKPREVKGRKPDEYVVVFESRADRDEVKAAAPALAEHREEAGMRLHVPDHLQRQFKALMNLSYDLKTKHKGLKRNIKFDDGTLGLYLDIQIDKDEEWQRIDPEQALEATKGRRGRDRSLALSLIHI